MRVLPRPARRRADPDSCDAGPTLEAVARKVGLAASTLTRRFQRELGVSPREWLAARKSGRFKAALRTGDSVTAALYDGDEELTSWSVMDDGGLLGNLPIDDKFDLLFIRIADNLTTADQIDFTNFKVELERATQ